MEYTIIIKITNKQAEEWIIDSEEVNQHKKHKKHKNKNKKWNHFNNYIGAWNRGLNKRLLFITSVIYLFIYYYVYVGTLLICWCFMIWDILGSKKRINKQINVTISKAYLRLRPEKDLHVVDYSWTLCLLSYLKSLPIKISQLFKLANKKNCKKLQQEHNCTKDERPEARKECQEFIKVSLFLLNVLVIVLKS